MASPKALLANELRWFLSLDGLLTRQDREDALLERVEQMSRRITTAEEAAIALSETQPAQSKEILESIENDVAQIMEIADSAVQKAQEIQRRRCGAPPHPLGAQGPGVSGRLPTLELSRFSGRMDEWVAYQNMFDSLVASRTDLSKAQKMAYLLSTLEGEARALVQHLRVEDDQYATAWELLKSRYQNTRLLADAHVAQLLALPRVTNRSHLRLQLLTSVTVACNALRTLGLPVDEWSFLLVHIVLSKLPTDIRSRFEREYAEKDDTTLPTFRDLMKFLEYEARVVETSMPDPAPHGASGPVPAGPSGRGAARGRQLQLPHRPTARLAALAAAASNLACLQCGRSGHGMLQCHTWQGLPVEERRRVVKRNRLCFTCLGEHFHRDCPRMKPCSACGGPHHVQLCMNRPGAAPPSPRTRPAMGGGAVRRSLPSSDEGRAVARHAPLHLDMDNSPAYGFGEAPAPPAQGYHVAGPSQSRAPMGGGALGATRGAAPPLTPVPVPRTVTPPGQVEPRPFSPPRHEYPRLEYHPPYHRYGRAAGYAPPRVGACTRAPYYQREWSLPGLERPDNP